MRTFIVLAALCIAVTQAEGDSAYKCAADKIKQGHADIMKHMTSKDKEYPSEAKETVAEIKNAATTFSDTVKRLVEEVRESQKGYMAAFVEVLQAMGTAGKAMTSAVSKNAGKISKDVLERLRDDVKQIASVIARVGKEAGQCFF